MMLLLGTVMGFSRAALAQDAGDLPDVGERNNGTGRHVGSFWVTPTIESGAFFDSNVYATSSDHTEGFGAYIAPRLDIESDWGRNALDISLGAKHFQYFNESDQSRTTFDGSIESRVDIQRDLVLLSGVKGGIFEDPVGSLNSSSLADEPTLHRELETFASLNKAFNRLSVSVGGAYSVLDYDNVDSVLGGEIDQDFRDGDTVETGGRVSYAFLPGYRVFADMRYNWRDYESNVGESEGWRGLTGVEFELGRLVRGEVGVGYMRQSYDDGSDPGVFSYHAGLVWNPTPLMTVNLTADRLISDSAEAGSSGFIDDSVKLRVDYEVLRALVLSPNLSVSHIDYVDTAKYGVSYGLGVQLQYTVNRFMSVGLSYDYTNTNMDNAAPGVDDFDRHVVGAYAEARF